MSSLWAILGVVLYDFIKREAEPQSGDIHLTTLELMLPGSGKIL